MFAYNPMTEEEAMKERFQLMADGEYDAVIDKAEARISANSGNPMMELNLMVYDESGRPHQVKDFLVFTRGMMWKVIHCVRSANLVKEYEEKKLQPELLEGVNVKVRIATQTGSPIPADKLKGKPMGSCYPDKNIIEDYLIKTESSTIPQPTDDFSDIIPF